MHQAGGNVPDGVFQDGHHEGKNVQCHDQHETAEGEKRLRDAAGERKQLLKQPAALHKQDPAHRRNIGRGHEGHHEHNIQPLVLAKLAAGQQIGGGGCDDCGEQHHTDAKNE